MLFKVFIKSSNVLKAFGFHSQTNLFELDFFMRKKSWRWSNQCQGGQNCCVMVTQFVLVLPIVGILVHCRSTLSLLPGCYALHCTPWAKPWAREVPGNINESFHSRWLTFTYWLVPVLLPACFLIGLSSFATHDSLLLG